MTAKALASSPHATTIQLRRPPTLSSSRNQLTLDQCLFANVIPLWDGTRKISREQRALAGQAIAELIGLLPALCAIVLVGLTAQRAWDRVGLQAPPM